MMCNWQDKSDFEINKAVADLYLPCDYLFNYESETVDLVSYQTYLGAHGIPCEITKKYGEFNPCNAANDAWSIILDSKISHDWNGSYWCVMSPLHGDRCSIITDSDKCVLRAAMIVYLEMKGAQP